MQEKLGLRHKGAICKSQTFRTVQNNRALVATGITVPFEPIFSDFHTHSMEGDPGPSRFPHIEDLRSTKGRSFHQKIAFPAEDQLASMRSDSQHKPNISAKDQNFITQPMYQQEIGFQQIHTLGKPRHSPGAAPLACQSCRSFRRSRGSAHRCRYPSHQ